MELNNLPNSLKYISLPYYYQIIKIPPNLKTIECSKNYAFIGNFNKQNIIHYPKSVDEYYYSDDDDRFY